MRGLTLKRIAEVTGGEFHLSCLYMDGSYRDFVYTGEGFCEADPTAQTEPGSAAAAETRQKTEDALNGAKGLAETFARIAKTEVSSIVTDSRKIGNEESGAYPLFGAIAGARVDGHDFIPKVFQMGALGVLCERPLTRKDVAAEEDSGKMSAKASAPESSVKGSSAPDLSASESSAQESLASESSAKESSTPNLSAQESSAQMNSETGDDMPAAIHAWIQVENTEAALGKIAAEYLEVLGTPVVGITGSVGKTSTKEMIASVLSKKLRTLKTAGNFNNQLGLPLTVFRLKEEDEVAVLEMGVSHFGDMTYLAKIAHPNRMVITNIGTCHLEFLKDREGVFRAKTEVFDYMKPGGRVILNGNDDLLRKVLEVHGIQPVFFGVDSSLDGASDLSAGPMVDYPGALPADQCVTVTSIRLLGFEGSECTIRTPVGAFTVTVPVPGIHNCSNAAAATAVGLEFGMTLEEIRDGIESAQTIAGRFRILRSETRTVIDDCYNANPVSMKSSLAVLANASGRRVAILGDMGELGENEIALHEDVGEFASSCADHLVMIGPLSRNMFEAARRTDPKIDAVWYESVETFLDHAGEEVCEDDTVLVKASHYMGFGRIVDALI